MAAIYDGEGYELAAGLQGCDVCSEAFDAAQSYARERMEPVWLSDDDGEWVVYPDGSCEEADLD